MEKTMRILKVSGVICFVVCALLQGGEANLQPQQSVKSSYPQPQVAPYEALESVPASEVEYVDGPLAPLYDFLIQRRLTKFCKLLRDAGLEEVLQGLGGYWTMFVPTDASFIYLPGGTLEDMKRNPQLLRDFILYHFVTGDFSSSQILNEMIVDSVQGAPLRFNIYGNIVTVSGAQILEPDLQFELGRVHIIDHPLYPIPATDTVSYLKTSNQRLYRLLLDAGLLDYLSSGTFTILAPDDDAFGFLSAEFKDALASNRSLAEKVLLNHILPGSIYTGGITDGMRWETVGGEVIVFTTKRGLIFANGIPIVLPDVPFTNGVIHVLNRVLLPEGVDADCQCKPSGGSPRQPQSPAGSRPPSTPGRSPAQSFQTQPPFGRQPPTARPGQPAQQPQGPFTPSRIGQTPRPLPQPNQITRSPIGPSAESQPEDDSNTLVGPGPHGGGQGTTRYPPPPRGQQPPRPQQPPRVQPPRTQQPPRGQQPPRAQQPPSWQQPPRGQQPPRTQQPPSWQQPPSAQQPQTIPDNAVYPEQEISPGVTNTPRTTSRWVNRQPTQAPRYPTPPRGPATTRRPQTTRSYNRVTPPTVGKVSKPDGDFGQTFTTANPQQQFQTQKPATSWQQRQQVTPPTRRPPTQQRTTYRPPRPIPPQQSRPTQPRPGSYPTPSPALPQPEEQPPFESNRQRPDCRQRSDILTPNNQNLPICPESDQLEPCQRAPYNPSDPRPLCPNDIVQPGCRESNEPFNPSDTRPQCPPSLPDQGCRMPGQPTYVGDRRPVCSPSPPNQVGCRDPSAPFSPTDNRPLCATSGTFNPTTPAQEISQPRDCRKANEPQDNRPLCPTDVQGDCRPFLERPKAGDRRPVCKINRPTPQQNPHDPTKGQAKLPQPQQPQRRPTYPQPQGPRSPNTQTTRRPSWQTTRAPFDVTNQVFIPGQPPASGNLSPPSQQPGETIPGRPQTQPTQGPYPVQPQTGRQPFQPQTGRQPVQPQTGRQPVQPQTGRQPVQPQTGGQPVQPQTVGSQQPSPGFSRTTSRPHSQGPYPQVGITNQPYRPTGSADFQPSQPFIPQRRPISPPRQQTNSYPGRGTSTPRVPVSVTGTTTPGEDTRRTLYEIVEDPALLIRGTPVKLTKIFSLFHKAGIEDILSGPGPITVFLPSDDAFATLPKGVVDQLEENPELLRQVLMYHVTNVEILPSAQGESYTVPSLEGNQLVITMLNGGRLILISGAKAIAVTRANNGIFYVINQLMYPLPHQNIVGAIQSRPDLSTLALLLPMTGLIEMLQGQTPYTLLAPTDNAFAQLPPAVFQELSQNVTALQEILLNHIIEGAHYGREFLTGGTFPSARGGKLKFQVVSYGYQVNDINIKTPEIVTGTGVIHLIDQILLEDSDLQFFNMFDNSVTGPDVTGSNDQQQPGNALQPFQQPGSRLQPGVQQPQIGGQRLPQGPSQPTGLIPPSSQRIGQRPPTGQRVTQRPTTGGQTQVIGNTNFGGQRNPQPLTPGQPSFGGRQPTNQLTGQRQPSFQPQSFTGGTVVSGQHANVADLARAMGLNRFADWVSNTGLLEKIHDGGVYTVFAPTDDAVNSLPQDMVYSIDSNPEQTKPLLQYHIIPRRINLNSLSNDETSSTLLQGKTIRFNVYSSVTPDCKQLVTASGAPIGDALATMGSVQVIPVTQVLYQPTGNLMNIVDASPILKELSQAVKSARLSWVLSGTGPLTFFAPSDTAFQSLTPEQRQTLIEDKQAFSDLIKRHLVRGTFFSSGVQEDLNKNSEKNTPMKLSLQEGILTINSVPVTYSDITATNGVLHVIDQFL
ncbi:transforming growth factor-beta-induced protein ig-h3 [Trichonephila inaurata madagascariensis]|uniref:Transforming growth factor-beta-induced protein ig-h3 n=1 Tax=Trichonephila inaurata madagascariensis TaxID=2747483 RepID=A0A8X6XP28_9ARAC|nr:transforming growth factor-beta-induced protein ig-h3 [Trichonephila inaurata madagascariensis]